MRSVWNPLRSGKRKREGLILAGTGKTRGDDMALMMEAKDVLLSNLKEGRLVSCEAIEVEEVTVLVNPSNEKDVRIMY